MFIRPYNLGLICFSRSREDLHCVRMAFCNGRVCIDRTYGSRVYDHLQKTYGASHSVGVACVYINYKEEATQSSKNILGGLWRQLAIRHQDSDRRSQDLKQGYDLQNAHRDKGTSSTSDEIQKLVLSICSEFSTVFFMVDALDEYPSFGQDRLLKDLLQQGDNVRLLITGRPHVSQLFDIHSLLQLEISARKDDVEIYIQGTIQDHQQLNRLLAKDAKLKQEVVLKLSENAKGMSVFD